MRKRAWLFGVAFSVLSLIIVTSTLQAADQASNALRSDFAPLRPVVKPLSVEMPSWATDGHVVFKFKRDVSVRRISGRPAGNDASRAVDILAAEGLTDIEALVDGNVEQMRAKRQIAEERVRTNLPDMSLYYQHVMTDPAAAERVINKLNALDEIEIAFYEPLPELANIETTPNYIGAQDYLEPATGGVNAYAAWTVPGGNGSNVKIIDIEGNWNMTHEDLTKAVGGLVAGTLNPDLGWKNHGTAVIGEMIADHNGFGVTGISHGADIGMVSVFSMSTASALNAATNDLDPGDLILIELHAPGPNHDPEGPEQNGFVCMEYFQSNFDAIVNAWANGVIVCEAAGNGGENYDDLVSYDSLFQREYRNSHAIICGAGMPPTASFDRSKYNYSCYGSRVDLQGYGGLVVSSGYGDLQGGPENEWYTQFFSGTSSASPIVTGAAACMSSFFQELGSPVDADSIRNLLVATGSPQQQPNLNKHIGPRPDLKAAMTPLFSPLDSIWYLDTEIDVNAKAAIPVRMYNKWPVNEIYLPFKFTGPAQIFIDSLTHGPRTDFFAFEPDIVFDNRFNGEIAFKLQADIASSGNYLQPGDGIIAYLWIRTNVLAQAGQMEDVDSATLSGTSLRMVSAFDNGPPDYFEGCTVSIVEPPCDCPNQGDFNVSGGPDGVITILDVVYSIDEVFRSGPASGQDPVCPNGRADVNKPSPTQCGDGVVNILDVIYLIDHVFRSGPAPCDPCDF